MWFKVRQKNRHRFGIRVVLNALYCIVCLSTVSCSSSHTVDVASNSDEVTEKTTEPTFTTFIRKSVGPPVVKTDLVDMHGQPVSAACNTCHTTRPANRDAQLGQKLPTFHQGISGAHGKLNCVACHHPDEGYQSLRLADGKSLPYTEVMQLCAQCHGPQYRDYQHGAHGGMNGYWDLSRGNRTRNNCIDCHHPHSPKYRTFLPVPEGGAPGADAARVNKQGGGHE